LLNENCEKVNCIFCMVFFWDVVCKDKREKVQWKKGRNELLGIIKIKKWSKYPFLIIKFLSRIDQTFVVGRGVLLWLLIFLSFALFIKIKSLGGGEGGGGISLEKQRNTHSGGEREREIRKRNFIIKKLRRKILLRQDTRVEYKY